MALCPRLKTVCRHKDGSESLLDLSLSISSLFAKDSSILDKIQLGTRSLMLGDIKEDLSITTTSLINKKMVSFPLIKQDIASWAKVVESGEGWKALYRKLSEQQQILSQIDYLESLKNKVIRAQWNNDLKSCPVFFSVDGEESIEDPEDILEDWGWSSWQEESLVDDKQLYQQWVRKNAPPFVWGSEEQKWKGLSSEEIVDFYTQNLYLDREEILSASLSDFADSEDLETMVKNSEGLSEILSVASFLLESKTPAEEVEDSIHRKLYEWNQGQDIKFYWLSEKEIFPAFPDSTKEEALAWLNLKITMLQNKIYTIDSNWQEEGCMAHYSQGV